MAVRLNYESRKSKDVISQILAYLLGRPLQGATQQQIAAMLGASHGTANRFIQYLVKIEEIHIEQKARATNHGHLPAIYKYGPRIVTRFPRNALYQDLPLTFFGRSKPMNTNETPTAAQPKVEPKMTDWFKASAFHPPMVGPFQCTMVGAFDNGDGTTHMRWWDGEHWSYPLQPEHDAPDGSFYEPATDYFIRDEVSDYLVRFAWRGFAEDQDPL